MEAVDWMFIGSGLFVGSYAMYMNGLTETYNDYDIIMFSREIEELKQEINPDNIVIEDEYRCCIKNWKNGKNLEIFKIESSVGLEKLFHNEWDRGYTDHVSPEGLFALKAGHIHFPMGLNKFNKHIADYSKLKEVIEDIPFYEELRKQLFKDTEDRIGKLKTPSLMKKSTDFFGQSEGFVKSWFVHDDIHKVMSHYDEPLYEKMKIDPELVTCSKDLWNNFSYGDKCKCVLEEAYVIALERKIIPMLFGGGHRWKDVDALKWALYRICTTLCSGWFRKFATDNYVNIFNMANLKYVSVFLEAVDEEKISKIKEIDN
jgi:hypothetical protein